MITLRKLLFCQQLVAEEDKTVLPYSLKVPQGVYFGESVSAASNIEYTAVEAKTPNGSRRRASSAADDNRSLIGALNEPRNPVWVFPFEL